MFKINLVSDSIRASVTGTPKNGASSRSENESWLGIMSADSVSVGVGRGEGGEATGEAAGEGLRQSPRSNPQTWVL